MVFRLERTLGDRTPKRGGFTLIELLVVIAIIGILAAVVLVSLNNARIRGRDARRLSDLQSVSLAMELYADADANNYYPNKVGGAGDTEAPTNALFNGIVTDLNGGGYLPSATVNDPINSGNNVYYGLVADSRLGYILGAQLEQNNQSCSSDYDGGATKLGGTSCSDGATANDCGSADTAATPDFCICQGAAC